MTPLDYLNETDYQFGDYPFTEWEEKSETYGQEE